VVLVFRDSAINNLLQTGRLTVKLHLECLTNINNNSTNYHQQQHHHHHYHLFGKVVNERVAMVVLLHLKNLPGNHSNDLSKDNHKRHPTPLRLLHLLDFPISPLRKGNMLSPMTEHKLFLLVHQDLKSLILVLPC
jgi:hypothetical protein